MIRITLYNNCKLTKQYQDIFSPGLRQDNKTPIEYYLESLSSTTIDCDTVYQENKGTLIFDIDIDGGFDDGIYGYNYMKIETVINNELRYKRYCFIESISLKNEYCYVDYEEDVWHSYSNKINGSMPTLLSKSYLSDLINNDLKTLPIPYKSNNDLEIFDVDNVFLNNNFRDKYTTIVEIQYYDTAASGEQTNRHCELFIVSEDDFVFFSLQDTLKNIKSLILNSSETTPEFEITDLNNPSATPLQYRFQVGKIYVFPTNMGISGHIQEVNPDYRYTVGGIELFKCEERISQYQIKSYTIQNDYKNISVGTLSNQIKIINNGTTSTVRLFLYKMGTDLSLLINYNNELLDITSDFEYEYPIKPVASEELAMQKLNRTLEKNKISRDVFASYMKLVTAGFSGLVGIDESKSFNFSNTRGGLIAGAINTIAHGVTTAELGLLNVGKAGVDFGFTVAEVIDRHRKNEAKFYTSNEGRSVINKSFLNCSYGICGFRVIEDNIDEVNFVVEKYGYDVNQPVDNITNINIFNTQYYLTNNKSYNAIKFENIMLYGNFPQDIATALSDILNKGTRIHYGNF